MSDGGSEFGRRLYDDLMSPEGVHAKQQEFMQARAAYLKYRNHLSEHSKDIDAAYRRGECWEGLSMHTVEFLSLGVMKYDEVPQLRKYVNKYNETLSAWKSLEEVLEMGNDTLSSLFKLIPVDEDELDKMILDGDREYGKFMRGVVRASGGESSGFGGESKDELGDIISDGNREYGKALRDLMRASRRGGGGGESKTSGRGGGESKKSGRGNLVGLSRNFNQPAYT